MQLIFKKATETQVSQQDTFEEEQEELNLVDLYYSMTLMSPLVLSRKLTELTNDNLEAIEEIFNEVLSEEDVEASEEEDCAEIDQEYSEKLFNEESDMVNMAEDKPLVVDHQPSDSGCTEEVSTVDISDEKSETSVGPCTAISKEMAD